MSDSRTEAPVVLVHGIFGFDQLTLGRTKIADYFRRIPKTLRDEGHVVPEPPQLNPAGSVAERAGDLQHYLEDPTNTEVVGQKVHIVAHSMGGLDARYMISKLGMADRVLSLTTIGTPHHGSPIADLVVAGTNPILAQFVEQLGVDLAGIADLTTEASVRFNTEVVDSPQVQYFSVAGRFEPSLLGAPLDILGLSHNMIRDQEGNNDGLVSVSSATFGQLRENWSFLGTWEADHFRLINWGTNISLSPFELMDNSILANYKDLIERWHLVKKLIGTRFL